MRRVLAAAMLGVLAWVVAACGIAADDEPHAIVPPAPYQDFASTAPPEPSDPPQSATPGSQMEILYLIRDGRLVEVSRPVDQLPSVETLVAHLTANPTAEEQALGLVSALTVPSVVDAVSPPNNGIVTVALGPGLDGISPDVTLLAFAQLVCTLDAHPSVTGVTFTRDGAPWPVARGDGNPTEAPLTAADYSSMLEPR